MPFNKDLVTDEFVAKLTSEQKIEDELRRFVTSDEELSISYASNDVKINMATGEGTIITYRTIPLLGQMTILHMDTSKWWIYYSDLFGAAMIAIAFTGMFIEKGKNSFRSRGFKLALLGMVFPLIFLFLLS